MEQPLIVERSPKESHLDTIWYEIDRWHYAIGRLTRHEYGEAFEKELLIEGALLHFRNLVQFMSAPGRGNLVTATAPDVWADKVLSADHRRALAQLREIGSKLYSLYWDQISFYLQHITTERTTSKAWDLREMSRDFEKGLAIFAESFPKPNGNNRLTPRLTAIAIQTIPNVMTTSASPSIASVYVDGLSSEKPTR